MSVRLTEASKTSPGVTKSGSMGWMTTSALDTASVRAAPTAPGAQPTAMIRSLPLNCGGTGIWTRLSSGPTSSTPDQKTMGASPGLRKGF